MALTTVTLCVSRFPPCCRLVFAAHGGSWSPATHHHWPPKFKAVVHTLLLSRDSAPAAGQAPVCQEQFIDSGVREESTQVLGHILQRGGRQGSLFWQAGASTSNKSTQLGGELSAALAGAACWPPGRASHRPADDHYPARSDAHVFLAVNMAQAAVAVASSGGSGGGGTALPIDREIGSPHFE